MNRLSAFAVALAATTLVGSASLGAYAAQQVAAAPSPQQTQADKDFVSLSDQGQQAMRDIRFARLAIFQGDTDQAKTLVGNARDQLGLAKTSDAAFMKAEADIKPPAGMPAQPKPDSAKPSAQAVAWLPVGGQVMVDESFQATPENQQAVAAADTHLKAGEKGKAEEALKATGIDVNYVMALAPLDATTSAVDKAATLIDQGKFYEANLALKGAEEGVVVDVLGVAATPAAADTGKAAAATPAPAPAPAQAANHAAPPAAPAAVPAAEQPSPKQG